MDKKYYINGEEFTAHFSYDLDQLPEAAQIRSSVFLDEQKFTVEFDDIDSNAVHCLLCSGEKAVGVGRAYADADGITVHIGRIAVVKEYRGKGIGSVIVRALEGYAAEKGYSAAVLSAQTRVRQFYEKLGYTAEGEEYFDEYCPHVLMRKALNKSALTLQVLQYTFSVCKTNSLPADIISRDFVFISKTDEELSLVCPAEFVPDSVCVREDGWNAFRISGVLDFSLTGILSPIAALMAENKIGIFAVSTFNTDYILIKNSAFQKALGLLKDSGYAVEYI